MPYGFRDDKSQFDLADISPTTIVGTFTPNADVVYSSDISVSKSGIIGHVVGAIRLKTVRGGKVGTISGVGNIVNVSRILNVHQYAYGRSDMILDTNGDLYIYPVYSSVTDMQNTNYLKQFLRMSFESDE